MRQWAWALPHAHWLANIALPQAQYSMRTANWYASCKIGMPIEPCLLPHARCHTLIAFAFYLILIAPCPLSIAPAKLICQ